MEFNFEKQIKTVADFPKKGILFYDITPILLSPAAYAQACDAVADSVAKFKPQAIVSPEARGFFFGIPVAMKLGVPFIPVRKKGKLPRQTASASYALEYGTDSIFIHKDDVKPDTNVAVIDDILATGGTAKAMCQLLSSLGAKVACCSFLLELEGLNGRECLSDNEVLSVIKRTVCE